MSSAVCRIGGKMKRILIAAMFLWACGIVLPLFANLPCENGGCDKICPKCGKGGGKNGGGKNDAKAGNSSPTPGTGTVTKSSVAVRINWGAPANEDISGAYQFSIYSKKPNPVIYSPQIIQYRNLLLDRINISEINYQHRELIRGTRYASYEPGYQEEQVVATISNGGGMEKLTTKLASDVTHEVRIFTADRETMTFQFKVGSSIGTMIGETATMDNTLRMVNSAGEPTTGNPAYYDRYLGQGNFLRYSASTGNVVSYHTAMGRVITPDAATVGVEPIYDADGTVRQVWSLGDGLADVVVTENSVSYEIRCYSPDQVGAKADGVYTVTGDPHTVWRIENPNPGTNTKVKVTKTVNGVAEVWLFEYSFNSEGWLLKKPGDLAVESQSTTWDYSKTVKVITDVEKTPSGQVASKVARTYQTYPFGDRLVNVSVDPDGANLRTQTTYYTDSTDAGSYGRTQTENFPDGNWAAYQYDSRGREIRKVTPWKNAVFNSAAVQAKAEYRDFTALDSRDTVENDDIRPRTEETKILGITTSKTYHAYYFDGNEYVEIEERCTEPGAAYGATSNLRTEWRYYPKGNCTSPSAGRMHTVKYPNGTQDTYTYEYGTWTPNADPAQSVFTPGTGAAVRVTVTHGTTANPAGVANKTTQDITVYDTRGCKAYTAQTVYTGSDYEQFAWVSNTYDQQRRELSERKSNNELTEYTWNCCAKASETFPDGTQYTYIYDDLKRLVSKTKVGCGTQPDLVTTYQYDAANRKVAETITGGNLSTSATWEYNLAGQLTREVDHQGLITTYVYTQGVNSGSNCKGKTIATTLPGGFTTIQETYCDRQLSALTGTAQVAEYYDYGVNVDGKRWALTHIGGGDSPRWTRNTIDLLKRLTLQEKSGFNGTISKTNFYNAKNQLIKTTQTGQAATLYEYDSLGNQVRSGLDVDDNGTLDLAGNDRITEQENTIDGTWLTTTTKVYGTTGSATATTVETTKIRLNGWTGNLSAETQATDIYGNITTQTAEINRANKTLTVSTVYPDSTVAEQSATINGLRQSNRTKTNLTTTYSYDGLGRVIGITEPRIGTTTTTYYTETGKIGQKNTVTDAAGNVTAYDYDSASGRLLWEKNALNQYTRYAYNTYGQVTNIWGDTQYPVEFGYDQYGQKTTMHTYRIGTGWTGTTWPIGVIGDVTTWTYDPASGVVTTKADAANHSVTYSYTVDGKLASRTWARGIVTNYSYDSATGELLNVDYADNTPDITYTYNRLGKLSTVIDAVGTRTFAYNDTFGLISETINGIYNKVINRSYTATGAKGKVLGMSIGNIQNYAYAYDTYGRLNQITTPAGDFNYTRLTDSDLVAQMTRPNGIITTYAYEPHRDLITEVNNGGISIFGYTNNAIGNRSSMSRSGTAFPTPDTVSYTYNDRSEVTGASSNVDQNYNYTYNFDPIGNRTTSNLAGTAFAYTSNNLNQYITINTEQPTYDADGNMLIRDGWTQVWNGENDLIETSKGDIHLTFAYDYMGRRVEKKIYNSETLTKDIRFVYDSYKLIEELDAINNNTSLRRYTWQPASLIFDTPLSVYDVALAKTYCYHSDANKNVTELTDSGDTIAAHYEYSPFGQQTEQSGDYAAMNSFCISSEYFDSETKLAYYNYRYYDPQLGRWLSRDPIDEDGGLNLYVFAGNNGINKTDTNGLFPGEYDPPGTPGAPTVISPWMTPPDEYSEERRAFNEELLRALLGISDVSTCFSDCMNNNAFPGIPSIEIPFAELPKKMLPPFRQVSSTQPGTSIFSSFLHTFNPGPKLKALRHAGRYATKVATPLTIANGFYDLGLIISCICECSN